MSGKQPSSWSLEAKLALLATGFAAVVVMLGAWTRLVDAGLGCPDWPGCYGFLTVPESASDIAIAESRFPDAPVEVEKGWPEMIHRYFAGTLGLIILGFTIAAYRRKQEASSIAQSSTAEDGSASALAGGFPKGHALGLLVLVTCQAIFGMWTVTLKLWPKIVSLHLLGGFATLSLLFLLFLRMRFPQQNPFTIDFTSLRFLKRVALVGIVLVVIQIFLGAWTAANYAALACGSELPGCQGSLWPEMDFASGFNFLQTIGPNYLGGILDNEARVAIQVAHRIGAVVVLFYLAWMIIASMKRISDPIIRRSLHFVGVVLVVQFLLGLSNVIWLIPLSIAVAHNAVGALLLLTMVNLNFQLYRLKCSAVTESNESEFNGANAPLA